MLTIAGTSRNASKRLFGFSSLLVATIIMSLLIVPREHMLWRRVFVFSDDFRSDADVDFGDDLPWDTQSRDIPLYNHSFHPQGLTIFDEPTNSFRDNLRPDLKYITSWGLAGFSNDFEIYMHLLLIALLSGRVAILPPVTGSTWTNTVNPPLYLSKVFDLERLSRDIRVPILEWHNVKNYDSPVIDNLGGWSHKVEEGHEPSWDNIVLALNISMAYTQIPYFASLPVAGPGLLSTQGVAALTFPTGHKKALSENPVTAPSSMNGHKDLPDEHLFVVRELFYAGFIYSRDLWESDYSLGWRLVGQHAHFTARIEWVARNILRKVFGLADGEDIPPFISLHVRRGDFAEWCRDEIGSNHDCYASVPQFERFVSEIKQELATREINPVHVKHVYVASNEPRRVREGEMDHGAKLLQYDETGTFWADVEKLGWGSFDWEEEGIAEAYGNRYPGIIEAAILSMASGFVGTNLSTFSLLAKLRVETWNGGITRTVHWGDKHTADTSDGIWRSQCGI